jgi:preprotein translocase subunit SecB
MSDQQPVFSIEKLYVKDLSLEVPNAPQIYLEREAPQIEIQLQTNASGLGEDLFEVILTVTVTAKRDEESGESKGFFLVEVAQAGIFQIKNVPESDVEAILGVACPNILFPYAREVVSDAVNRAGFPPVILAPVNFESLYQQRAQSQQEEAAAATLQ